MQKIRGFTLIEVLIAMIVLAIGLLGFAGLQAASLRNNQSSYNRSQATQLAYDLADRMRANPGAANSYLTSTMAPADAVAQADCTTVSASCTNQDMAQNDLFEWNAAMTSILPAAAGSVTVAGNTYTITINWDDNRDGNVDTNDPNFQMSFQL